jgi:hypothetical protein
MATDAEVAENRRRAQLRRDNANRRAFLSGYLYGMCRRNCWAYAPRHGEDIQTYVSTRRVEPLAVVRMFRVAESFRRAQYAHLDAAARWRAAGQGGTEEGAWAALGDAFGVSRNCLTADAFVKAGAGPSAETLQAAARAYGRAGLYRHADGTVTLDDHYQDENGRPKA